MEIQTMITEDTAHIRLRGRFEFPTHREFRGAVKDALANPSVRTIAVDLHAVDYMDSSALGMLLLSRENAQMSGKSIVLKNVVGPIRQTIEIANFQRMFDIW